MYLERVISRRAGLIAATLAIVVTVMTFAAYWE